MNKHRWTWTFIILSLLINAVTLSLPWVESRATKEPDEDSIEHFRRVHANCDVYWPIVEIDPSVDELPPEPGIPTMRSVIYAEYRDPKLTDEDMRKMFGMYYIPKNGKVVGWSEYKDVVIKKGDPIPSVEEIRRWRTKQPSK